MSDRIETLKLALVKAREANEKAKEYAAEQWKGVEDTTAHRLYQDAVDEFKAAAEAMLVADKALRDAALEQAGDGAGEVSPGVKIQMRHKIKYVLEEVETWARTQAAFLFKFDVKAFEKSPPTGAPFEKYDEPYVVLATKNEDFQLPV
jgi:hypothetical protein